MAQRGRWQMSLAKEARAAPEFAAFVAFAAPLIASAPRGDGHRCWSSPGSAEETPRPARCAGSSTASATEHTGGAWVGTPVPAAAYRRPWTSCWPPSSTRTDGASAWSGGASAGSTPVPSLGTRRIASAP